VTSVDHFINTQTKSTDTIKNPDLFINKAGSRERRGIGLQNIKRINPLHFISMDLSLSPSVSDTVCVLWGM
jgi:hypothetical protein